MSPLDNLSEQGGHGSLVVVHEGESIQAAIDRASPGDIIEVGSGTYHENVHVNRPLIIRGVDMGVGLPVIDAGGSGNAVEISSNGVTLDGLTVANSARSAIDLPGAGIRIGSHDCIVKGITAYNNGYGVNFMDSSNNTLTDCIFSDNDIGVQLYYSNDNTLKHNNISKCQEGILLSSSNNNIIIANAAENNDYGIDIVSSNGNTVSDNLLYNNSIMAIQLDELSTSNLVSNNPGITEEEPIIGPDLYLPPADDETIGADAAYQSDISYSRKDRGESGDDAEEMLSALPLPTATEKIQSQIDEEIGRLPWGQIAFPPPERMSKDVPQDVVVRISRDLFENVTKAWKNSIRWRRGSLR